MSKKCNILRTKYNELIIREEVIKENVQRLLNKSLPSYHMNLLHEYNEIKDAAQIILGAIARVEGFTLRELHERFELPTTN